MSKLKVEQFVAKIDELTPTENNPRQISKQDFENLKKSMKEFPEMREIRKVVVDENNRILGGHMRIKALKELGESEVPVDKVYGLTEKQKRRFVVQDNIQNGEWDMDELANSWSDLPLDDWGIDVEWDTSEQEVVEDEAPEVDESEPADSVLGGVYQLGRHRLMCGDSTDAGNVAILMDGQKADMVFTDPPYNIAYKGVSDNRTIKNDKMPDKEFVDFLEKSIMVCPTTYVCCSWQFAHLFKEAMTNLGMAPKAMIVWDKVNPAQHLDKYYKQHELIYYYGKFGGEKTLRGDVWQLKRQANTIHPTMKPIELIIIALKDNPRSEKIYDGFGGSGSTLIACEQLGRKCYMMELDPKYCDVIRKRYWKFKTGSEEGWKEGTKEAK